MTHFNRQIRHSAKPRYRILKRLVMLFAAISLFQILWAPEKEKIIGQHIADPAIWSISYVSPKHQPITRTVAAPTSNGFVEGRAIGSVTVEMTLPQCRTYRRYRFWVGPYGSDSTTRQPIAWTVFMHGNRDNWIKADSENFKGPYSNDRWYNFRLNTAHSCVSRVRLEITKFADGDLFRLYQFELYNPNLLEFLKSLVQNPRGW